MEPNPIFQLELNQAKRNGLFWTLLLIGIAEGFSRFCFVILKSSTEPILAIPFFISLAFYLVQFFLPLSFAWKIASQRLNEDLILATAMSPLDIMLGKVRFAICCGALLYVPAILVSLLTAFGPNWGWWILYSVNGFLFLEYAIIIGLGFMAGAKTLGKTTTLVFLLGQFGITIFIIFCTACSFHHWTRWNTAWISALVFIHVLGIVSAAISFVVGLTTFGTNYSFRKWTVVALIYLLIASVVILTGSLWKSFYVFSPFTFIIPLLYFVPPISVVCLQGIVPPGVFEDSSTTAGMEAYSP